MSPRTRVGMVSGVVPLVSARPARLVSAHPRPISTWRHLEMPPVGRVVGELPRSRRATPRDYDLLEALVGIVAAPVILPAMLVRDIAEAVEEEAAEEQR